MSSDASSGKTTTDRRHMPMHVTVPAFNRDPRSGRCLWSVEVFFEGQHPWRLEKYFTDFVKLHRQLEVSQYSHVAKAPPKHPVGLKMSMAFKGKQSAMRSEVDFLKQRRGLLEDWLNDVLVEAGPDGVDEVVFLNLFFNAFSDHERKIHGHANLDRSMLHMLKSCRIPKAIYRRMWADGYTLETLHTVERETWAGLGVSIGSIEQLEVKLGGLRHAFNQTVVGPDGQITSVVTDAVTGQLRGTFSQGVAGAGRTMSSGSMGFMQQQQQQMQQLPQPQPPQQLWQGGPPGYTSLVQYAT